MKKHQDNIAKLPVVRIEREPSDLDSIEKRLANSLQLIPSGGGESGAYGIRKFSDDAAKLIRQMIERAIEDSNDHGR